MKKLLYALVVLALVPVLVPGSATLAQEPPSGSYCFHFEQLPLGQVYKVGDVFAVTGAAVEAQEFEWSNGMRTPNGFARVGNSGMAGGQGYEIQTNNITLAFEFVSTLPDLTLLYGEYGGNLNISINKDFVNFGDFTDIDGKTIGGVTVSVKDFGQGQGLLALTGPIDLFAIGGQELWFDDTCTGPPPPPENCIDFEQFHAGSTYAVGDSLDSIMVFKDFQWANGTMFPGGVAVIDVSGMAGGLGNDLNTNNITMALSPGAPLSMLSLRFGEYGGNLNLEVNGDFRNFGNFADINNTAIGGAFAYVTNGFGNDRGSLTLVGNITSFLVGGQELWLDDICYCTCAREESQ
jgi:hypothetical protein